MEKLLSLISSNYFSSLRSRFRVGRCGGKRTAHHIGAKVTRTLYARSQHGKYRCIKFHFKREHILHDATTSAFIAGRPIIANHDSQELCKIQEAQQVFILNHPHYSATICVITVYPMGANQNTATTDMVNPPKGTWPIWELVAHDGMDQVVRSIDHQRNRITISA